ncbi:hypothetical protein ACTFIW_002939 [Dictyostelium discoideum]
MKRIHFVFVILGLLWISGIALYMSSRQKVEQNIQEEQTKPIQGTRTDKKKLHCDYIDMVYTWVNGSDPKHIDSRTMRSGNTRHSSPGNNRYRDLMGLKYSLRSIKKFAPWIKNVWVVSASQYPTWFDPSSDEVKFIFHEDYYSNQDDLPTFNSNSIESNFYSLPKEVSDCFIYFNDDIFFGAPVSVSDFWDSDAGQAIYKSSWTAPQSKEKQSNIWHACIAYTNDLLNNIWEVDNKNRHYASHGHQFFTREIFDRMYQDLEPEFKKTSANPFRTAHDLQIPFLYLAYVTRFYATYEPTPINYYALIMDDHEKMKKEFAKILAKKPKTVCLNDGLSPDKPNTKVVDELEKFFETYLPERGSWEKSN